MHKHSLFCRAAALVLTLALTAALALPGFAAAYAMPIQTAYDAEAVYLIDASTGEALVERGGISHEKQYFRGMEASG